MAHLTCTDERDAAAARELFNRGNAAFRAARWSAALADFNAALTLEPMLEPAALQRARCLVQLNHCMPAREAFAQVLRLNPANYSAWLEAGHLCRSMGEMKQALAAYQRAIDAAPQRYEAFLGMTRALEEEEQFSAAEQTSRQAAEAAAQHSAQAVLLVHRYLAKYRLERGDTGRALQSLRAALTAAAPAGASTNDIAELQIDLGEALLRQGRAQEAFGVWTAAAQATSEAALTRLAQLGFRNNRWQEAVAVARRNLELHPESALAHWNLAHLMAECWQMEEAEQSLRRAEALGPVPESSLLRATIAGRRGDVETALRLYLELAAAPDAGPHAASRAVMAALYSDALSAGDIAMLHRRLFAQLGTGARTAASFQWPPLAGRRLKLGIVSADFHHQHPVNIFMQPVLREIDRSRFEVFLYFTGVSFDDQTRLAKSRVEHWREATVFNDLQLARRIDTDGIDLLLDLAGHTGQQRMHLFAQRAAPVQATYLGYPGSTGVPNMDWLVGDGVVTPPGCDSLYSERIARLPGTVFCYAPEEDYPYPFFTDAQARRPLTFGSFNNAAKLTTRTLRLWGQVLQAVPGSRLLLRAPSFDDQNAVQVFQGRLESLGVETGRVAFLGPVGLTAMMASYAEIDIGLDTLPYNGGTTTLQALWMGVPVITLEGDYFVSRMGASFMHAADLGSWVAKNEADYVAIASAKAADRTALLALKKALRGRLRCLPAWDVKRHARALEDALYAMAADTSSR